MRTRVCVCQVDKRVILRMDLVFHLVYVQNPMLITRCICARVSVFEIGGMLMNPGRMYKHRIEQQQGQHNIVKPVMFEHQNYFLLVEVQENVTVWVKVSRMVIRVQFCTYVRGDRLISH